MDSTPYLATRGAIFLTLKQFWVGALGLAISLIVVMALTPEAFAPVAIGTSILLLTLGLTEGGLGAKLIQRHVPPSEPELRALIALSLLVATGTVVIAIAVAHVTGESVRIIVVIVSAGFFHSFKSATLVELQRNLEYRPIAASDALAGGAMAAFAAATLLSGMGASGLALSFPIRGLVGLVSLSLLSKNLVPIRLLPSFDLRKLRHYLGFGIMLQAAALVNSTRDMVAVVLVGVLGSPFAVGNWGMAMRLVQAGFLVLLPLRQVTFPAFARMRGDANEPTGQSLRRAAGFVSSAFTGIAVPLAVLALVAWPRLFSEWTAVPSLVLLGLVAVSISGPTAVVIGGYLLGAGRSSWVLIGAGASGVVWLLASVLLYGHIGVNAVGLGLVMGATANVIVLLLAPQPLRGRPGPFCDVALGTLPVVATWLLLAASLSLSGPSDMVPVLVGTVAAIVALSQAALRTLPVLYRLTRRPRAESGGG